jgi:hypothetical protein
VIVDPVGNAVVGDPVGNAVVGEPVGYNVGVLVGDFELLGCFVALP